VCIAEPVMRRPVAEVFTSRIPEVARCGADRVRYGEAFAAAIGRWCPWRWSRRSAA